MWPSSFKTKFLIKDFYNRKIATKKYQYIVHLSLCGFVLLWEAVPKETDNEPIAMALLGRSSLLYLPSSES